MLAFQGRFYFAFTRRLSRPRKSEAFSRSLVVKPIPFTVWINPNALHAKEDSDV